MSTSYTCVQCNIVWAYEPEGGLCETCARPTRKMAMRRRSRSTGRHGGHKSNNTQIRGYRDRKEDFPEQRGNNHGDSRSNQVRQDPPTGGPQRTMSGAEHVPTQQYYTPNHFQAMSGGFPSQGLPNTNFQMNVPMGPSFMMGPPRGPNFPYNDYDRFANANDHYRMSGAAMQYYPFSGPGQQHADPYAMQGPSYPYNYGSTGMGVHPSWNQPNGQLRHRQPPQSLGVRAQMDPKDALRNYNDHDRNDGYPVGASNFGDQVDTLADQQSVDLPTRPVVPPSEAGRNPVNTSFKEGDPTNQSVTGGNRNVQGGNRSNKGGNRRGRGVNPPEKVAGEGPPNISKQVVSLRRTHAGAYYQTSKDGYRFIPGQNQWCLKHHTAHPPSDVCKAESTMMKHERPMGWQEAAGDQWSQLTGEIDGASILNRRQYMTLLEYHHSLVQQSYDQHCVARDKYLCEVHELLVAEKIQQGHLNLWCKLMAINCNITRSAVFEWSAATKTASNKFIVNDMMGSKPLAPMTGPNGTQIRLNQADKAQKAYRVLLAHANIPDDKMTLEAFDSNRAMEYLVTSYAGVQAYVDEELLLQSQRLADYVTKNPDLMDNVTTRKAFATCFDLVISFEDTPNAWGIHEVKWPKVG